MTDEFMFGRSILAAPIVNPQYTEEKIVSTDAMTGWDRQNDVNANDNFDNAPMYNLAGQRVSKSYKGIVIQNGKKMIKK